MLRPKVAQFSISLKLALTLFLLFFIILVIRSNFSVTSQPQQKRQEEQEQEDESLPSTTITAATGDEPCGKTPPSLAAALVHYATTNITPQQTFQEISVSMRVLAKKSPCNFLVFGLGHDSLMWAALNHGGRTLFLEEDKSWIDQLTARFPSLQSRHITYDTRVHQADELMRLGTSEPCRTVSDPRRSECRLALKNLPAEVYETEWDAIMVDAPTGFHDDAPGRMGAIYTAGLMARNREGGGAEESGTHVFVHDVDRVVEDKFSMAFLCEGYLVEQENRLRHFLVPSHTSLQGTPFCP